MGAGSKSLTTGYNYWGSYAIAVANGPLKKLNSISNGDTVIWEGPIDVSSADAQGRSVLTTSIGEIDFYWGLSTQQVDALLSSLSIDFGAGAAEVPMPAYKRISIAVCYDVAFGDQTVAPTLLFDGERATSGLTLTAHQIDGDAVIPEVLFDLLTNPLYGAGIDASLIDDTSFEAAAEVLIAEGMACSPDIDSSESIRDLVGRMQSYIDGIVHFRHGKFRLDLIRVESTAGIPEIDEADLLDEPSPTATQFEDTWNKTLVTFRDRDNKWEEATEQYDDPANAAIVGEVVERQFNFPWVTRREVAKVLAKRLGIRGGIPAASFDLKLKPEHSTLAPGDLIKFSYAKFGIVDRILRVMRVRRGGPRNPDVTITAMDEQTRSTANDFVPDADTTFTIPGTLDPSGTGDFELTSTTHRISTLPTALKDGFDDGLLMVCNRSDLMTVGGKVWWTYDPLVSYRELGTFGKFPAKMTVVSWHQIRTTNWLFRLRADSALDYEWFQALESGATEWFGVVGIRLYKSVGTPKNEHQVLARWLKPVAGGYFTLIDSDTLEIELEGGAFGTDELALEELATDSETPTLHMYFGRMIDFFVHTTDELKFDQNAGNSITDTALERFVKVTIQNHVNVEDVADVAAVEFDRNDSTMCPEGTYSRDWGARAPTGYELFDSEAGEDIESGTGEDIDTIDAALGAILDGTETATQTLVAEHVDAVLGSMTDDSHRYYNE